MTTNAQPQYLTDLPQIKSAGHYNIFPDSQSKMLVNLTKKPSFIHSLFTRLLLGWVWVDKK